ncbi:MAG: 23S rRNA (uracil(1939)-C(5))-methyltransferase RlmD [Selenomonadaceae bacterium]|nr:23S rRNA (uracil(1939)-C(5))-methyltransferase RlmD [Selenomonadaceae bacterium]
MGGVQEIELTGLTSEGQGVGRLEGLTVFVDGGLPSERVAVSIVERKKNYAVGRLTEIIEPSVERIEPRCPLAQRCGGCQLQHMNYAAQLNWKRRRVIDAIERIGKLEVEVEPTIGMADPWRYRNKMQFPVGRSKDGLLIGCYETRTHEIVDTNECLIQRSANDDMLRAARRVLERFNISAYDEDRHVGVMRHVMGRVGADGETMLVLVTATNELPHSKAIVRALREELPHVTTIQQNVQTYRNNVILGRETRVLYGARTIRDRLNGLRFNISARSFFQVNTTQAERLYSTAIEFAGLSGRELLVDAYCGTGTITLSMARRARRAIGIEVVSTAVNDARLNARENGIGNAEFILGDVERVVPRLVDAGVEVVVIDPPRAGCDARVLRSLAAMRPSKIIYVSCNPATLARDLSILSSLGYRTKKIRPVDMFPMTAHVESVTLLEPK